ncbi:MAG: hypothetical protein AAF340_14145 [Pseudomonadota bacterium]
MIANEFILVLGMVIGVLAIPGMFSSIVDGSPPRAATVAVVVSGAMIIYAVYKTPGGYSLNEIPNVIARVVGSLF